MNDLTGAISAWIDLSDGVTISGGEPFDQPDALLRLLRWLKQRTGHRDVLVYSGYPLSRLRQRHAAILDELDVLISEPFVVDRPDERPFVGSANQRVELLTDLARERYSPNLGEFERQVGISIIDGAVLLAGVPKRGDLARVAESITASVDLTVSLTNDAV